MIRTCGHAGDSKAAEGKAKEVKQGPPAADSEALLESAWSDEVVLDTLVPLQWDQRVVDQYMKVHARPLVR